jgi:hypothetical protein
MLGVTVNRATKNGAVFGGWFMILCFFTHRNPELDIHMALVVPMMALGGAFGGAILFHIPWRIRNRYRP